MLLAFPLFSFAPKHLLILLILMVAFQGASKGKPGPGLHVTQCPLRSAAERHGAGTQPIGIMLAERWLSSAQSKLLMKYFFLLRWAQSSL